MSDVKILASGFGFPEGPVVMPDGAVILTEIRNGRCSRVTTDGKSSVFSECGGGPNGLAIGPDGALYLCNNGGARYVEGTSMSQGAHAGYKGGSIQRLDAKTGQYKWHYQTNPAETWDYNAAMDIELADLTIDGKPRKVLLTAPKNGFLYVIDRTNGKLISAKPYMKTTWAKEIDLATGRPIEDPNDHFPNGTSFEMWPSPGGAHSWQPMAFSPYC